MSMNATPERPVPHPIAWSHDQRKQMMRNVLERIGALGWPVAIVKSIEDAHLFLKAAGAPCRGELQ